MNIKELLKTVDEGWVQKPKGFRVCYQKRVNDELITEYMPNENENPLESDVVAWRSAWKLHQATQTDGPEIAEDELVNIYVIDDTGKRIKYYATNLFEVYNPYIPNSTV